MRQHSLWAVFLILSASLLMASCGSDDDAKKDEAKVETHKAPKEPPAPICPQVAVVRGLDVIRNAQDDSADPAKLIAGAKLVSVDGNCSYDDESGIDVTFHVNMVAKRGPGLTGLHASFPYFVAVLDPNGVILNKIQMTAKIDFSGDDEFTNAAEAVHVLIPLSKSSFSQGPYYRVLSGFQLTPEQEAEAKKQN